MSGAKLLGASGGGGGSGSGWVPVESKSASNSSEITFTGMTQANVVYVVVLKSIIMATDNVSLYLQSSSNNGSSYDSAATDYMGLSGTSSFIPIASGVGNDTGESLSSIIKIYEPTASHGIVFRGNSVYLSASGSCTISGASYARNSTTAINAIRLYASSGNITSGTFDLWYIPSI